MFTSTCSHQGLVLTHAVLKRRCAEALRFVSFLLILFHFFLILFYLFIYVYIFFSVDVFCTCCFSVLLLFFLLLFLFLIQFQLLLARARSPLFSSVHSNIQIVNVNLMPSLYNVIMCAVKNQMYNRRTFATEDDIRMSKHGFNFLFENWNKNSQLICMDDRYQQIIPKQPSRMLNETGALFRNGVLADSTYTLPKKIISQATFDLFYSGGSFTFHEIFHIFRCSLRKFSFTSGREIEVCE